MKSSTFGKKSRKQSVGKKLDQQSGSQKSIEPEVAKASGPTIDKNNITLDTDYEDNDFNIYFTKRSLIEYVESFEDDNLFKLGMNQDIEDENENKRKVFIMEKNRLKRNILKSQKGIKKDLIT